MSVVTSSSDCKNTTEMHKRRNEFRNELRSLINRYSQENWSNTPDYILTTYLMNCLQAFEAATYDRDQHCKEAKGES